MTSLKIEIKNCNNLDSAVMELEEQKLNIKFAPNGTGKSSIARALELASKGDGSLQKELMPFKFRKDNPDNKQPEIKGAESLQRILCFNEEYVSQFVFRPDELLRNSFDILLRTSAYKQKQQEIENAVSSIKSLFSGNKELESLIDTLKEIGAAFKLTKTGISKASTGMKGLAGGNKIQHIPQGLEAFTPFIRSDKSVGWVDWQTKGYEFAEMSDSCPFCTSNTTDKKEQIKRVGEEYDKNTIKNLVAIIGIIERLGDYFSEEAKNKLQVVTTLKSGLEKEHEACLFTIQTQIDNFTERLERLRLLSGFQFKDGEKVSEKLPEFRLDLQFFSELDSPKMRQAVNPINASIDEVIKRAGQLQGMINQQRNEIRRTIERHQNEINEFLVYAGYRYQVEIVGEGEQAQLKLRHVDHEEHLAGGNQHLSFGERNAFAIVLFMYECLAKAPDLIILDDPISSFDKNKKYAILEMLFRRDSSKCLKSKTVLMLTHDVGPIIDTMKALSHKFGNQTSASHLKLTSGKIAESEITKGDIQTFTEICQSALSSSKDEIVKLIYLRRYFEIVESHGNAYQVLSNLLHKGNGKSQGVDTRKQRDSDGNFPEMEDEAFASGCNAISEHLNSFSYPELLRRISDESTISTLYASCGNGYEKLQLFRLLDFNIENTVIQKFINETYHIENEFICQLDPSKFDTIPEYVILECDKLVATNVEG